jgi:peptidoglycan/LPS O-acetylase OafA/YrhL
VLWIGSVTHVRIDALFFGVWLAHGWYNCWDTRLKARIVSYRYCWTLAGLVLMSSLSDRFMNSTIWNIFGFILNYVGAGCLLIAALSLDYRPCNACPRFLAWLGKHSYSVYLWHMLALEVMQHVLGGESPDFGTFLIKEFLFFAVSWILGIVLARTTEFPMMRLRDKLFPAKC